MIVLPWLLPELTSPMVTSPPFASAFAMPPFPALAVPLLPAPATLLSPPLAEAAAVPPSALIAMVVSFETFPPSTTTAPLPLPLTAMVLPRLLPELMSPMVMAPPLALARATPPFPAAAAPLLPATAMLPSPPLARERAVPPSALRTIEVELRTLPPEMRVTAPRPNQPVPLRWTWMVLPRLLPELMSPTAIVPPFAFARAMPPLPAAAAPLLPARAMLSSPPFADERAVPPSALIAMVVSLRTLPPSISVWLPQPPPPLTAMLLPRLLPELMLSRSIMPPLALASAMPAVTGQGHTVVQRERQVVVAAVGGGQGETAIGTEIERGGVA